MSFPRLSISTPTFSAAVAVKKLPATVSQQHNLYKPIQTSPPLICLQNLPSPSFLHDITSGKCQRIWKSVSGHFTVLPLASCLGNESILDMCKLRSLYLGKPLKSPAPKSFNKQNMLTRTFGIQYAQFLFYIIPVLWKNLYRGLTRGLSLPFK